MNPMQFDQTQSVKVIQRARLPQWALPKDWPKHLGHPQLADLHIEHGKIARISPQVEALDSTSQAQSLDLEGALLLPSLVDAHTHLDKTLTLSRMGPVGPGLLNAIQAMMHDRAAWTPDDVKQRASQALGMAWSAGVTHIRSHCDCWEPGQMPLAWRVLEELSQSWMDRIRLERVALIPLTLFKNKDDALFLAQNVKASQNRVPGAMLGGFIHSSNWDAEALENLLFAAQTHELDLDLHVDEELNAHAQGLKVIAKRVLETGFSGRVVCGHTCALSQMPEDESHHTLDQVAKAGITLVTLPITNLFLQDAQTDRTPRMRGMTLIKEARARGIPVLIASDNVQDPFCAMGSYDPMEAFSVGVPMGQLSPAFDEWSELLCRPEWIHSKISPPPHMPFGVGAPADLICFTQANATGFPSQTHARQIIRAGILSPSWEPKT